MSARVLLGQMGDLLREQVDHIASGDTQALLAGVTRHEELLAALDSAEIDLPPDELRAIGAQLDRERDKVKALLTREGERLDFMLRLLLGGGEGRTAGYPGGSWRQEGSSRMLNHRA